VIYPGNKGTSLTVDNARFRVPISFLGVWASSNFFITVVLWSDGCLRAQLMDGHTLLDKKHWVLSSQRGWSTLPWWSVLVITASSSSLLKYGYVVLTLLPVIDTAFGSIPLLYNQFDPICRACNHNTLSFLQLANFKLNQTLSTCTACKFQHNWRCPQPVHCTAWRIKLNRHYPLLKEGVIDALLRRRQAINIHKPHQR